MPVTLNDTQTANYTEARRVFDAWFDSHEKPPFDDREAGWVRLVAALDTETGCLILAHTGEWHGGGEINQAQKDLLRASAVMYRQATGRDPDGFGSNGGSVGALQQIPTPVAMAADRPWGGWGTVVDCMVLATSVPKFLAQLGVTADPFYKGRLTSDPVVADLLRVQQPLASEVAANYGAAIVARAREIAARFPRAADKDWLTMATTEEVKKAFQDAIAPQFAALNKRLDQLGALVVSAAADPGEVRGAVLAILRSQEAKNLDKAAAGAALNTWLRSAEFAKIVGNAANPPAPAPAPETPAA